MNMNVVSPKTNILLVLFALASSLCLFAAESKPAPCASPEYRQFDFWVGDWDAFDVEGSNKVAATPNAHVRVERILDGCVLREEYAGADGLQGQSFTIYDAARKLWHQTWVTNRGQLLVIEGGFRNGEMVLSGAEHKAGKKILVRGTWKPVKEGVRETAVTSGDGGKTWKLWFDILFRQRSATASDDDAKTVAALDTEYQLAVKTNDSTAMDRILSDDFILVTGAGKTFSKSDLLDDARSGRTSYEHQEDTAQTVRVWGDTAVVTAKLWEKGTRDGKSFDKTLWFSDTYVRTPAGWRYVFGQASLPLP